MTSFDWINGAVNAAVGQVVQTAEGVVFADGSRPAGVDPAQIYAWFHNGPATASYISASSGLSALARLYPNISEQLKAARKELADGWKGDSARAAVDSFGPTIKAADELGGHAGTTDHALTEQVTTFTDTRNRLISVPSTPPKGPGMNQFVDPLNPGNFSADAQVAAYQIGTHTNQDAYGAYQGPTNTHTRTLPQDGTNQPGRQPKPDPPGPAPTPPGQTRPDPPGQQQPRPTGPAPGQDNGSVPGHTVGAAPGQDPGSVPGHTVGVAPGQDTGAVPGRTTGATPGSTGPAQATSSSGFVPAGGSVPLPGMAGFGAGTGNGDVPGGLSTPGAGAWGSSASGRSSGGAAGAGGLGGALGAGGRTGSVAPAASKIPVGGKASRAGAASPGSPGMGAPGQRGKDDEEHHGRGLVKQDWENDVIGDLPPHVPPVLDCGPDGYPDED